MCWVSEGLELAQQLDIKLDGRCEADQHLRMGVGCIQSAATIESVT